MTKYLIRVSKIILLNYLANFLMLQREVSDSVNMKLAKYAREKGIKVILDVGGQDIRLEKEFLINVDIISPNETELLRIIKNDVEFDAPFQVTIQIVLLFDYVLQLSPLTNPRHLLRIGTPNY